jgi:hypothetical protein
MAGRTARERCRVVPAPRYRTWLLRRWAGKGSGDSPEERWQYSLEYRCTGARRSFANLSDLVAYLQGQSREDDVAPCPTG